ncbi:MAG: DNA polymerase I [Deltaproteobacteria bacterium RIFCSPLOWO2_12_FULL_40_28]|nr:MAG: DNA polymerase I [Deltaproteobacteria bacterium RIFCSPHIGHO2_02_FULL_40_28]OGQ20296.1 MAG: DNA polymerase I [Deltaproteobacteria bacterium RIFCSPHIGHO2_12_FULL_40_32]OGQ40660.1 MAG: DNA polymerase I [Deltaproteobacteria bacterium RIFCSPLOWO2_02_FULL_40_36]OGQ54884.1 MAG: DNA polymerase I [Deltaproteobacteria bacterium RIFCSPLOWO2_12_FULL_40_28]
MKEKIYLVDISSFIFRAYFAIRQLATSKGVPTNATYGVINMLLKFIREQNPAHLVMVFDSQTPTFRKKISKEYKANREAPPEDLIPQFDQIKKFVSLYPFPSIQVDGFEADDLIASVVKLWREGGIPLEKGETAIPQNSEIVVVTGDKDLMQLVGDGVTIYDSMKEKIIDVEGVKERFGVNPSQVLDVLSLSGDASDNIPGVSGVGEKTATKLISQFGSLENLYEHLDEVPGKTKEKLQAGKEAAFLSKKLVSLYESVQLQDWKCKRLYPPETKVLNDYFRELEFSRLISDVPSSDVQVLQNHFQGELISSEHQLKKWVDEIKKAGSFAFDTETTGLDPFVCHLVGISLGLENKACYIPVAHHYMGCPSQLSLEVVKKYLSPLFEDPALSKYAHHAKFDLEVLGEAGFLIRGITGDSMVASYLLNPEEAHNMDSVALEFLQHTTIKFADVVCKGETFDSVELQTACNYAAEDAWVTFKLNEILLARLVQEGLDEVYKNVELPLVDVLCAMEKTGVFVDENHLNSMGKEFRARLSELENKIFQHAGTQFNVNSPKQVGDILFVKLQLPPQRKTKTGYSTDVDVLTTLAKMHPLPQCLLQHRMLTKLLTTYVDQLLGLINPKTGRIHTSYNQTVVATGRLSSTEPNLQNIPIRTSEGRRIRKAFKASKGYKILSADYSQIELRLLAEFSQDKALVLAFQKGMDIHRLTASKLFSVSENEVNDSQRALAKTVNFGIMYGQSPFGLASLLEIPQSEAKRYIDNFYKQYPSVKDFKEQVLNAARQKGFVETWKKRRRFIPEINSKNQALRNNAERTAFNTVFQGSAADLIKVAMIDIHQHVCTKLGVKMIMQVHDELVFEVPEEKIEDAKKHIQEKMEKAIYSSVPLKVDVGIGEDWDSAH